MPKKEKYRLQSLLRVKEIQRQKAEIILAKRIKEMEEEKDKLKTLEDLKEEIADKREKARREMRNMVSSGQSRIRDSQFHLGYMTKLQEDEDKVDSEIKEQEEAVELAEEKLKKARRDYVDAAQEQDVMEKHKELWMKKQARNLTALENKQMNELGNTLHQLSRMRAT